jgi:hypothetical protein
MDRSMLAIAQQVLIQFCVMILGTFSSRLVVPSIGVQVLWKRKFVLAWRDKN